MKWILLFIVCITGAFAIGRQQGKHEVMSNTVVRAGFPRFLNQQYFGECVRVAHNMGTIDAEACATLRGDQ